MIKLLENDRIRGIRNPRETGISGGVTEHCIGVIDVVKRTKKLCSIDGCEGTVKARDWCNKHWYRWRRHGDPLALSPVYDKKQCAEDGCDQIARKRGLCERHYGRLRGRGEIGTTICKHQNCDRFSRAHGYCAMHLDRWQRNGDTPDLRPVPQSPQEIFSKNTRTTESGCVEWQGSPGSEGYVSVTIDGKSMYAHRFSWELHFGAIPDGKYVDHRCFNTMCVNPQHLRLLTPAKNAQHQQGPNRKNTTGFRGVQWRPLTQRYVAVVSTHGKRYHAGTFTDLRDAAIAAAKKRQELGFPLSEHDHSILNGSAFDDIERTA